MSNNEKLSALVDGELHDDALLKKLTADEDMTGQYGRYNLIGDVMRGEVPQQIQLDLSDKVMAALENEPVIVAPKPRVEERPSLFQTKVVPLFKQFGQYAIAASVAAVVVGGVQLNTAQQDPLTPAPVLDTVPFAGVAELVSLQALPQQQLTEQEVMEQRRRINAFLQDHKLQQRMLQP